MTDNLPAVHTGAVVSAPADTDSWAGMAPDVFKLAGAIAQTEFVPRGLRGSEPATAAAILYGREVGLPPMTALTQVHVIEGRPSISAEAQRALVYAAGHEIQIVQADGGVCRLRGRRRGWEAWTDVQWTIDNARAAGLLAKKGSAWASYPRQMLLARATTELCRMIFPDVIRGFRGLEEAQDLAGEYDDTPAADAPSSSTGGGTVQRKRRTTRKARPPADMPTAERPTLHGPPLPGEAGTPDVSAAAEPSPAPPPAPPPPVPDPSLGESGAGPGEGTETHPAPVADGEDDPAPGEHHDDERAPALASKAQLRMVMGALSGIDKTLTTGEQRDVRLVILSALAGRPPTHNLATSADLTRREASAVIDTLAKVPNRAALDELVAAYDRKDTP